MSRDIQIISSPDEAQLARLGVRSWPIWSKEASEFPWTYDEREMCYLLKGQVEVTPQDGRPVTIRAGDLVTFPQGMSCHWRILSDVRKHYQFG